LLKALEDHERPVELYTALSAPPFLLWFNW
jgi:hypothetical protein